MTLEYSEVTRAGNGSSQHGIYMTTDQNAHPGSVFRMRHCWVHDMNGGNAVKSRAERNEIHFNWLEGTLYHLLELIGPDEGAVTPPPGIREDSDVVGNVLVHKAYDPPGAPPPIDGNFYFVEDVGAVVFRQVPVHAEARRHRLARLPAVRLPAVDRDV